MKRKILPETCFDRQRKTPDWLTHPKRIVAAMLAEQSRAGPGVVQIAAKGFDRKGISLGLLIDAADRVWTGLEKIDCGPWLLIGAESQKILTERDRPE